jgi:putative ABC transport system permease protein
MNLIKLSWKNVLHRPLSSGFTVLILTLGIAMLSILYRLSEQVRSTFENNMAGVDMVVGAKGSPLQLILSALFQYDVPTGNISLNEAKKLSQNRYAKKTIPLSYGDSYQGIRIIGTDASYIGLYGGKLTEGRFWEKEMEVVIGSQVSALTNLEFDELFQSSHGLESSGRSHETDFKVVGILAPTNSILDRLILTNTESIWHVHESHESDSAREITALLVQFSSPMGLIQLPRQINKNTSMQAALPSFEINKLFSMLGIGIKLINFIGYALIAVAALSIWISMIQSLQNRTYELALLRTYGASRLQLFWSVLLEAFWLGISGFLMGWISSNLMLYTISHTMMIEYGFTINLFQFESFEFVLLVVTFSIAMVAAIIPSYRATSRDISTTLSS